MEQRIKELRLSGGTLGLALAKLDRSGQRPDRPL